MSKSDPWTHIKIRRSTLERMKTVAAKLLLQIERGTLAGEHPTVNPEPKSPTASGLSMNDLIVLLLNRRVRHGRRAAEQKERKRAKRAAPPADTAE